MAVYYKFKSEKDYYSLPMDGHFISVGYLKEKLFELMYLGGSDLIVINAQNNEEYLDEGMSIPKYTSVLLCRVPEYLRKPIVIAPVSEKEELNVDRNFEDVQAVKGSLAVADQSCGEDLECDEFGNDPYAMSEIAPVSSSFKVQDATPLSKEDEESRIKDLVDTPALDWQHQPSNGFNPHRGFARGGRGFGFEKKIPPQGYICHRCKVPGHFIQHCHTNGDTQFDIKRVKPPTGIPKSMLMAASDGFYALPNGALAILKPNEAAFEREIEKMPSTRQISYLPREPQEEIPRILENDEENRGANLPLKSEKRIALKVADASEATRDSAAASQGSDPLSNEGKPISGEAGPKKKKKKICMAPGGAAAEMQSMMNMAYNPGWNDMLIMPYANHYPFPQRDPSVMSGEEFQTRKRRHER